MKNFLELRTAAGLGDREQFCAVTGLSDRTLSNYDNDKADPATVLVKFLRLLANGCAYCALVKRANQSHPCESSKLTTNQETTNVSDNSNN